MSTSSAEIAIANFNQQVFIQQQSQQGACVVNLTGGRGY